jgi:hypothetical protein
MRKLTLFICHDRLLHSMLRMELVSYSRMITANVGTEGAAEKFLIWTDFEFRDRIPFISLTSSRIPMVYSSFCQNNSAAISDRVRFSK